jgi:hypothetical protein
MQRLQDGEVPSGTFVRALKKSSDDVDAPAPAAEPREGSASPAEPAALSSATRGDVSVADIRRQQSAQASAEDDEIASLIEQARGQEALGKPGLAKIFYQQAARRATGDTRYQLQLKIQELNGNKTR